MREKTSVGRSKQHLVLCGLSALLLPAVEAECESVPAEPHFGGDLLERGQQATLCGG